MDELYGDIAWLRDFAESLDKEVRRPPSRALYPVQMSGDFVVQLIAQLHAIAGRLECRLTETPPPARMQ